MPVAACNIEGLNLTSPLAPQLRWAFRAAGPAPLRDRRRGLIATAPNGLVLGRDTYGAYFDCSGGKHLEVSDPTHGPQILTNGFTIRFAYTSNSTTQCLIGTVNTSNQAYQILLGTNTGGAFTAADHAYLFVRDESNKRWVGNLDGTVVISDGRPHTLTLKCFGTGFIVYVDGRASGVGFTFTENTVPATGNLFNWQNSIALGARNLRGTIDLPFQGRIYDAWWHSADVGFEAFSTAYREPDRLFRQRLVLVHNAAGGGSQIGEATTSGSATVSATPLARRIGQAAATGQATVSATGVIRRVGQAATTGQATASATPLARRIGEASTTGAATVAATGLARRIGEAATIGQATVSATPDAGAGIGEAITAGQATVSATPLARRIGQAAATGQATVSATGIIRRVGQAITVGSATVAASPLARRIGQAITLGQATVSATGTIPGQAGLVVNTPQLATLTPVHTLARTP